MKILAPTDFSAQASTATDFAVQLARLTDGEVILHHAYSTLVDWVAVPIGEEEKYPEVRAQLSHVRQRLHDLAGRYHDVHISTQLSFYETVEELLADARREKVDLIVAGTHGRKDISNLILGSDAQRIIRLAHCPVIILRQAPARFPLRNLLFVSDFRHDTRTQLACLLRLADAMGARVQLGFVNTPAEFQNTAEVEERMARLEEAFPDYHFEKHIYNHERIDAGIRELSGRIDADGLAMITHARSGWSRLFYSSLTENLALDSDIPVISFHLAS